MGTGKGTTFASVGMNWLIKIFWNYEEKKDLVDDGFEGLATVRVKKWIDVIKNGIIS